MALGMPLSASAYETVFDDAPDGLLVLDPDTNRIHECNERACEIVGHEYEALLERDVTALIDGVRRGGGDPVPPLEPDDDATLTWLLRTGQETVEPFAVRLSPMSTDGERYVLARLTAATDDGARTGAPDLALKSRAIDTAPIGITISDPEQPDNPLLYVNEGFEEVTGYSAAEAVGRNCRFLQGPETRTEPVDEMRAAIGADEPITVELKNYRADGTVFWNRVTIAPIRDDEGTVTNYVGFQEDVTERVESRQALELADHLLKTVPSGVFRTEPSPEGTFEYANPALASLLGVDSADQLQDRRVADFYADPDARAALVEALRDTDAESVTHEVTLEPLAGDPIDVMITASLAEDEAGTEHVHKVVQDITERKERERQLERYERLVENLPIGVYQNTPGETGQFRLVNDAMAEIFDADSAATLCEHSVRELYADPDERAAFSERLREQGVVTEAELELTTLCGEPLWGAVTAITRDVDGTTVFDGVIQDITERKRYEQRLKEQRDNLDVLNQMLRHDIRNDLQLVTAYADFLRDHVDDAGREYLETIHESATHAVELTQTARDMSEVMLSTDENRTRVDLRHTLESELERVRSEHATAAITVDGTIPRTTVLADDMLHSIFRNLLTNAIQHNDRGVPTVTVDVTERDETVVVRVADNGPGISDEQKDEIFAKGTKGAESAGTGLGLYLVATLVDIYGGHVRVEDNEPRGAVFVVELPTD
ncbi:PAS domain S-box protein [Natrinema sp. HArc-T2]|uniref:PAS domain S-box protein n=1 Tax=Natrinema sp. HArc-T2 TaxID=3242701 RepID=UPI00359D2A34